MKTRIVIKAVEKNATGAPKLYQINPASELATSAAILW